MGCNLSSYGLRPGLLESCTSGQPEVHEPWVFFEAESPPAFLFSLWACKRFWYLSQSGKHPIAPPYLRWTVAVAEDSPECCNLALPIPLKSSFRNAMGPERFQEHCHCLGRWYVGSSEQFGYGAVHSGVYLNPALGMVSD